MRFKPGVVTYGWGPQMESVLARVDSVSWEVLGREAHITSGREGNHSANSLHYWRSRIKRHNPDSIGAFDLRTWPSHSTPGQISGEKRRRYITRLKDVLGLEWDVVDEPTHIHCEHDPKPTGRTA